MCVVVQLNNVLLGKQHTSTSSLKYTGFHNILTDIARSPSTDDYHPRGKAAKAAQEEEAKVRLQSWYASEAMEAAPRTPSLVN